LVSFTSQRRCDAPERIVTTMSESSHLAIPEQAAIRDSIDNIDAALVHILAERFRCTQKVGLLKAKYDLPPSDPGRETRQVGVVEETRRGRESRPGVRGEAS
jgi:chorismate mutase